MGAHRERLRNSVMAHAKVKGWFHPEPAPAAPQVGARPARLQAVRPAALPTTRRPVYSGLPDTGGSELPATAADLSLPPSASAPVLLARRKPLPISAAPLQSVAPASAGSLSEAVSLERLSKFPIRGAKTLAQPLPYLARESPKLLVELQLFAETELRRRAPGGGPSEAALEVWLETFERFVGAFKTYGPVLRPLKAEVDARLRELADRAAAAEAEAAAAWTTQQTAEAAAAGRERELRARVAELEKASPERAARSLGRLDEAARCDVLAKAASALGKKARADHAVRVSAQLRDSERVALVAEMIERSLPPAADAAQALPLLTPLLGRLFGGDGGAPLDDAAAVLLGALPPAARAALGRQVDAAPAALDAERVSVATSVETAEHSLRP